MRTPDGRSALQENAAINNVQHSANGAGREPASCQLGLKAQHREMLHRRRLLGPLLHQRIIRLSPLLCQPRALIRGFMRANRRRQERSFLRTCRPLRLLRSVLLIVVVCSQERSAPLKSAAAWLPSRASRMTERVGHGRARARMGPGGASACWLLARAHPQLSTVRPAQCGWVGEGAGGVSEKGGRERFLAPRRYFHADVLTHPSQTRRWR